MFGFTKKFITTVAMLFAIFTLAAAPAGALEDTFLPGGNGPDTEPPFNIDDIVGVVVSPYASVEVSCTAETATARIVNQTGDFHTFNVTVDGEGVGGGVTVQNGLNTVEFPLVENQTVTVTIKVSNDVLVDEEITRDCLLIDPSYQVLADCDSGQAHVRLINNGDDTANMAVKYDGVPYALQPVAPHSSIDWLLAVDPGESADFVVKVGHDITLGAEAFTFDCPEEVVTPPTTTPTTPPTTPPVTPATPEPPITPETPVEPETTPAEVDEVLGTDAEQIGDPSETGESDSAEDALGDIIADDDKASGAPFGKAAVVGFGFLLLIALAAAIIHSSRQEMMTA